MVLRVQQLETDVRRLNGQLEEALQALRQLEAQTLERYVDIDRRLAAGNGAGGDAGSAADAGSLGDALSETNGSQETIQSASTSPGVDAQAGEEAAYRAAYELVRLKQFDDAVVAFDGFSSRVSLWPLCTERTLLDGGALFGHRAARSGAGSTEL